MKRCPNGHLFNFCCSSTFAWYSVSDASKTLGTADNDTLKTEANSYSVGGFTITPSFTSITGTPVLTNATGETYYYAGAASGAEIQDTSKENTDKYATVVIGLSITYSGPSQTGADILALWNGLANSAQVTVTVTDTSEGLESGAGLKFWTAAPSGTSYGGNSSATVTFATNNLSFTNAGVASGIGSASNSVYVGAKGVDDVIQTPDDVYVMHATTSLTGA